MKYKSLLSIYYDLYITFIRFFNLLRLTRKLVYYPGSLKSVKVHCLPHPPQLQPSWP